MIHALTCMNVLPTWGDKDISSMFFTVWRRKSHRLSAVTFQPQTFNLTGTTSSTLSDEHVKKHFTITKVIQDPHRNFLFRISTKTMKKHLFFFFFWHTVARTQYADVTKSVMKKHIFKQLNETASPPWVWASPQPPCWPPTPPDTLH